MGLDAGYRRLFLDMMAEYLDGGERTVFLTSHVIQDMERLADEIIFLERGGALKRFQLREFLCAFKRYRLAKSNGERPQPAGPIKNVEEHSRHWELFAFSEPDETAALLGAQQVPVQDLQQMPMSLEDAFIGYTGRY
jgi:ABC-2 type transport system ATP-binding protein